MIDSRGNGGEDREKYQDEPTGQTATYLQKQPKDLKLPKAPSGIRLFVSDTKEHPVGNSGPMGTEPETGSSLVLGRQDKVVRQTT